MKKTAPISKEIRALGAINQHEKYNTFSMLRHALEALQATSVLTLAEQIELGEVYMPLRGQVRRLIGKGAHYEPR